MHAEPTPTWSELIGGIELFVDPLLCGAVAGLVLGLLGVYVVLRRMVFVSAAITHAAGLGVALAFYSQIHLGLGAAASPLAGAFALGVGSTLLLALEPARTGVTRESLIGLVFILTSAAAILVGDRISQESHDIRSIIFGTAVVVRRTDLYATLGAGATVLALQLWLRRGFVFVSFDREGARVQGLPVRLLDALLLLSVGVMVSVTTRALGALPVFAFSVLPAIAALALCRRMSTAFVTAALAGGLAAVGGYVAAFFLRLPVGATQAALAAIIAGVAVLAGRIRG